MKKILFLISRFLDGGIDTVLVEYINNLYNLTNHQITLAIMLKMDELEVYLSRLPKDINIVYLVDQPWLLNYKQSVQRTHKKQKIFGAFDEICLNPIRRNQTKQRLNRLISENDVVIDFDSCFSSFMPKECSQKKISFYHFSIKSEEKNNKRRLHRFMNKIKCYDYLVTICNAMQEEAQNYFPEIKDKIKSIYNSVNQEKIREKSLEKVDDKRIDSNYIIAVERLEESQKDIKTLIEAYKLLTQKESSYSDFEIPKLYVIGKGNSQEMLENLVKKYNLNEYIEFLGFQSNPYPWILHSKALVHSAKYEGLPTVLIEALMLDKLIISSDCPTGPSEILLNGKVGILVPVGDAQGFANAIHKVITDTDYQEKMLPIIKEQQKIFLPETNISLLEELFE